MTTLRATAHAGEPVDLVVWRALGSRAGTVEATLDANPGLAGQAARLPEGKIIDIPVPVAPAQTASLVNLWD